MCGFGCSLRVLILYMMHHWLRSKADMRGRGEKKWLPGIVRVPVLFVGVHVERHAHNVCVLGERACGPCTLRHSRLLYEFDVVLLLVDQDVPPLPCDRAPQIEGNRSRNGTASRRGTAAEHGGIL